MLQDDSVKRREKNGQEGKPIEGSNNHHFHLPVHVLLLRHSIDRLKGVCVQSRLPRFLHGFLVRLSTNADPESMTKAEEQQHYDEKAAAECSDWVDSP